MLPIQRPAAGRRAGRRLRADVPAFQPKLPSVLSPMPVTRQLSSSSSTGPSTPMARIEELSPAEKLRELQAAHGLEPAHDSSSSWETDSHASSDADSSSARSAHSAQSSMTNLVSASPTPRTPARGPRSSSSSSTTTTAQNGVCAGGDVCPLQGRRVLFLDVDGVLIDGHGQVRRLAEQLGQQQAQQAQQQGQGQQAPQGQQGKTAALPAPRTRFSAQIHSRMTRVCQVTACDVVVSSSWQFYRSHWDLLVAFLTSCGWHRQQVHKLTSLNPGLTKQTYERPPYCHSRAQGIMKTLQAHRSHIDGWAILDDLPLASQAPVCVPAKTELETQVDAVCAAVAQNLGLAASWTRMLKDSVRYSLTAYDPALFSVKSMLFGFESNFECVYRQAMAITVDLHQRSHWSLKKYLEALDRSQQMALNQEVMAVLTQFVDQHKPATKGMPFLARRLVRTNVNVGLVDAHVERIIALLGHALPSPYPRFTSPVAPPMSPTVQMPPPMVAHHHHHQHHMYGKPAAPMMMTTPAMSAPTGFLQGLPPRAGSWTPMS